MTAALHEPYATTACPFCRVQTRLELLRDVREHEALQGDVACEVCEALLEQERSEEEARVGFDQGQRVDEMGV